MLVVLATIGNSFFYVLHSSNSPAFSTSLQIIKFSAGEGDYVLLQQDGDDLSRFQIFNKDGPGAGYPVKHDVGLFIF